MESQERKMQLLGTTPIVKALLAMGLPTMLGMMINALYNIVDAFFVGGLGESQTGAISVVFPLGQFVVGLGLLFGNGAASYISRLLGRGDKEKADNVASTAIYSGLVVGAVFIIFSVVFIKPLLKVLGATDSIMPYAVMYGSIYIGSSIFNVFNVTMNNIVTSEGAAKISMAALLTGAILNTILDPIFISVADLGVTGAAIATAISQCVSTIVYLIYIFSKKSTFSFSIKKCKFSKDIVTEILKIGVPTLVFQLLTSLSITFINNQAKQYGDAIIAAMGVVVRITALGTSMIFGFIKGFQPIAGFSYGTKNYKRLNEATKYSIILSTAFCVVLGVIMISCPAQLIALFTKGNADMINAGAKSLRANGISIMVFGFYTVYSSLFLALGKAKGGLFLGVCRQGICFIPIIFTFPLFWGLNGILYAQPIADGIAAIIAAIMAIFLHKQLRKERNQYTNINIEL